MFTIKTPTTHDDFKAYYALRYKVLSEPWGDPKGTEKEEVIGVVKLYKKDEEAGHVSHLAVDPEYQHQGIGHLLLEAVEQRARARGFRTLGTMARATATVYFEKYGFRIVGMSTPHIGTTPFVWMEKE